jgi:phosphoenolpyruvate-protein kinase (PTS system EI component)
MGAARRFLWTGTNDLTGSALGIDREDPVGAGRDGVLHPGMLRIIHQVIETAHRAKRQVTVCGEMAGDPEGALALCALQVDALSVAVAQLGPTRQVLAGQTASELHQLSSDLLALRTSSDVRDFLRPLAAVRNLAVGYDS